MDRDLTINSIAFKFSHDAEDKGVRQSKTRGVNTPDVMTIMSQDAVNSKTKVPERRHVLRFDRYTIDANNVQIITSAYLVLVVPETATSTDTDAVIATFRDCVADTSPDYLAAVLNEEK